MATARWRCRTLRLLQRDVEISTSHALLRARGSWSWPPRHALLGAVDRRLTLAFTAAHLARVLEPFAFDPPEQLASERLVLRLVELEDAEELGELIARSAESLAPWLAWVAPDLSEGEIERRIRQARAWFASRECFEWLITERESNLIVGAVSLHTLDWSIPQGELGYWLGVPYAKRGYASEAAQMILRWATTQLGLVRVEVRCEAQNLASQRVAERLGLPREGLLRAAVRNAQGRLTDLVIFGLATVRTQTND